MLSRSNEKSVRDLKLYKMAIIEITSSEELEFDLCPMGCGKFTDDIYGGPCAECEKQF